MKIKFINNRSLLKLFFIIILFYLLFQAIYYLLNKKNDFDDLLWEIKKKNLKSIQLLTGRFHFVNWRLGTELGEIPFANCPEKRCYAFRSFLLQKPLEKSDGIMVHVPNLWYMPDKTKYKRDPRQLWLFYTLEPQGLSYCSSHYNLSELDNWFNITATFKSDSSILTDYKQFRDWSDVETDGIYLEEFKKFIKRNPNPVHTITNLKAKNKKASVVWYVSHCETLSRREEYVSELMKYIDIDIYGSCVAYFPNSLKDPCAGKGDHEFGSCVNRFLNSYKFNLAFENSLCDEYISEKFWKIYHSPSFFQVNIVPVVRGAKHKDYLKVTHANSFINADKFPSPKQLGLYLNYLSNNESAYLEYFKWKIDIYDRIMDNVKDQSYKFDKANTQVYDLHEPFCRLCSLLHDETYLNSKNNKVWKVSEWFSKETNCWDHDEPRIMLKNIVKFAGWCI